MVAAAEAEAERNNWRGVVAVVDDGGWIILVERMDHAALTAGVELAPGKARAAALFKKPTQALEEAIALMRGYHVRRLIVVNAKKELVGVLALDDLLLRLGEEQQAVAGLMRAACSRRE